MSRLCLSGSPGLYCYALKERVAKYSIRLRRQLEAFQTGVEFILGKKVLRDRSLAHVRDHCSECLSRETVDQLRVTAVDVNEPRCHLHVVEASCLEQRIELPANQGVAAGPLLELDQAANRGFCRAALRMEICRPVVAFDHSDRAARPQYSS